MPVRAAFAPRGIIFVTWILWLIALGIIAVLIGIRPRRPGAGHAHAGHACTQLHDYAGHPAGIAAWTARNPRAVTSLDEISNPWLHEIIFRLRENATFQKILAQLETDRRQRFRQDRTGRFRVDPSGHHVRETAIVVWMPEQRGALGVYRQRKGGIYSYSNYAQSGSGTALSTSCDVDFTSEAVFHIRIHTHPWGTVPSVFDLEGAQAGIVDFVVSEKDGVPTIYIFSANGSTWEVPTRLLRPLNSFVTVASNVSP